MKNRSINMLIVGLLVLGLLATALIAFLIKAKENFPKNIKVRENGVTESILPIRDLKLTPSESKEYSVDLVCDASGLYHIYLDFEELTDGGMKPFVHVSVSADGALIYEGELAALLDGDEVLYFQGDLFATDPLVLTICYLMPYEIGNEAQGTYADFDIHLKIKKV